ncbi:microsomal dipeptidase precursor [Fusarium subglutinans]|uniref:Dipeptidase n=1 Tax=Gibberella subglutinans TaxID=42677 RepID=A0A8H5P728_GIBSU|nr:microsomal dipeptidase precursor [Fusarium subglutinans]KAF5591253.1 microsomal dipeptidase precursor [Fusarium subglutinans]
MKGTDMVWYFAYGSNMASTTLKKRRLSPKDSRPVFVSTHVLCFDVFGVPYKEPAMAGIRERTPVDDTKATPPVHGMAYLLSRDEYHRLIVSEGAGVAYVEMELIARTCSTGFTGRAATCEEIPVRTLMARFPFRPEALPSIRYMGLLIQGSEESGMPASYQDYLRGLPAYHKSLSKYEEFGASLFVGFWMPVLNGIMKRVKRRPNSDGNVDPWVGQLVSPKTNDRLGKLECLLKTLQQIDTIHLLIENFSDYFGVVNSSKDIETIFRSGRIASLIGVEGLHQIADSASVVRLFHKLGVRYITLCHDDDNRYADSSNGNSTNGGLSSHGLDMIREMNRIGMMIDLSHTNMDTQIQVLRVSQAPVIFSHSSCNSLLPSPRNVTDEVLDLLKTNKGLVMICFLPNLVSVGGVQGAAIDHVIDHILYAGQRIGFEHVGIGSDFDGMLDGPRDLDDVSKYPLLVGKLLERGLSEDVIAQVLGGNVIRVLGEVETVSRHLEGQVPVLSDQVEEVWTPEQKDILIKMGTLRSSQSLGLHEGFE